MEKIGKIEAVTERDIDLLLLEELNVSADFSLWLYSQVAQRNDDPLCRGAWHSITDAVLGESDIVVIYENGFAVLIENKIDALAQPEQGKRYKARGKKGVQDGLWKSYATCIVAPKLYLQKEQYALIYDSNLSYEDIANWFLSLKGGDPRAAYKAYILKEAIEQNRRGYTITPDQRVTTFWLKYWELAKEKYPELEMKKPSIKPANSDWPGFRPSILDKRFTIVHKLERGDVDLQVSGAVEKIALLQELVSDLEVGVSKAGMSAAIRIKVAPMDRFASFESQKDIAIEGMRAAVKLLEIGQELKNEI